jgi:hypothetical protein
MAGTESAVAPLSGNALRASIVAEMEAPPAPAVEAAPAAEAEAETVEAAGPDDSPEDAEVEAVEEDSDEETDADADPKAAKGLDAVRRAEQRMRAQVAADRAAFEAERTQHKQSLDELAEFRRIHSRAKYDPAAVLRAAGLSDEDLELAARAVYAESKAGQSDPARREAAAKLLREREGSDKLSALEKKQAEIEAKIEARQREEASAREFNAFISEFNTTAEQKHPLVAKLMKADAEYATQRLVAIAQGLESKGKKVTPAAVAAELDRTERARIKALGFDPDAGAKPKSAVVATVKAKAAAATTTASPKPTREQILAELSAGEFADT